MLRSMFIHNFIHFRERQELKFGEGVNFIIGANSTGKTACFELLRRCLSNKLNKTTSSVPNKDKLAYVVCCFKITDNFPDRDVDHVIACLFVENANETTSTDDPKQNFNMYKALCNIVRDDASYAFVQKSFGWHGCTTNDLKDTLYYRTELEKHSLPVSNIIAGKDTEMAPNGNALFNEIQGTTNNINTVSQKMDEIYQWLDERYVGVMPMRSIGPTQWTRSPNYQSDKNYKKACKRAEILNELLPSDKIDRNKEEKYSLNLSFPFEFTKTGKRIDVKNTDVKTTEGDTDSFELLKCPEGILEAKQIALVLSHKEFLTITLEEPDRGMHPQMIKKLRDLVLRHVAGKTVLIITHNPSMINQWSMSKSFVFSKIGEHDSVSHNIRKVQEKGGWESYGRNEEMKCVLFSPRVFFVEGITDKLVFEAIFSSLTTNPESPIADKRELKDFLLATEVMELQSASHGKKKMGICKNLLKETLVLYDFDQFTNHCKVESSKMVCGCNANVNFKKEYTDIKDFLRNHFHELEKACEDCNVFCRKGGDLEDRIVEIRYKLNKVNRDVARRIMGKEGNETSMENIKEENEPNAKSTDIEESNKKIEESNKQIEECKKKIEESKKKIEESTKKIEESKKEIKESKKEIEIEESYKQIEESKKKIEEGKKKIGESKKKIEESEQEIEESKKEIDESKKWIEKSKKKIEESKKNIEEGNEKIEESKKKIEESKKEIVESKKEIEIEKSKKKIEESKKEIEESMKKIEDSKKMIVESKKKIEENKKKIEEGNEKIEESKKHIDESKKKIEVSKKKIEDSKIEIEESKKEIQESKKKIEESKIKIEEIKKSSMKKIIKENIPNAKTTDIDIVAETLVEHSEEVDRFIHFLEKMSKHHMPATSEKRKGLKSSIC